MKEDLFTLNISLDVALTAGNGSLFKYCIKAHKLSVGPSFYRGLGYDYDEKNQCGDAFIPHIHPLDLARVEKEFADLSEKKHASIHTEFRVMNSANQRRWISCHGNRQVRQGGTGTENVIGLMVDITHYKEVEKEHAENERRFKTLLNNLPGMAYRNEWIDGSPEIKFVSSGVKELLGYEVDYYLAHGNDIYKDIIDPRDYKRMWDEVDKSIANREPFEVVYRIKAESNLYKWVWEKGEIIFDKRGKPFAMEGYIMDITRFKHEESKLKDFLRSASRDRYRFGDIIGKSPKMQGLYERILTAAASDANAIIYGESGTGKELVAKAIHHNSDRRAHPLIIVNCGAIPEKLMESEFFGYKKGAFTGANTDRPGAFAAANGGTLFLDELGEISKDFQVKLLRVLEGHGYTPIGSHTTERPDVRIIAATNRNLEEMVNKGKMRQDFFYRIHIVPIKVPPLRERKEDIPLLIEYFMEKYSKKESLIELPLTFLKNIQNHSWPGNVRELENIIQRYIVLGEEDGLKVRFSNNSSLSLKTNVPTDIPERGLKASVELIEKQMILDTLEKNKWRRDKTAKILGITVRTLHRKMVQHRIK